MEILVSDVIFVVIMQVQENFHIIVGNVTMMFAIDAAIKNKIFPNKIYTNKIKINKKK